MRKGALSSPEACSRDRRRPKLRQADCQFPFPFTRILEKLTIDLGATTITPEALKELNKLLATRELPVISSPVSDFEDFLQRMQQGAGP
jgi:hypothetical protein